MQRAGGRVRGWVFQPSGAASHCVQRTSNKGVGAVGAGHITAGGSVRLEMLALSGTPGAWQRA